MALHELTRERRAKMPDDPNGERYAAFLTELSELSRKHGILIDGCGCHGSPYLVTQDGSEDLAEHIEWDDNANEYFVNLLWGK